MTTTNFLEQMRLRCQAKAKEMAALELGHWTPAHESALQKDFGFTPHTVKVRKAELQKTANS